MTGKILNLKKTGEILGVTDRTVQNLIERGELRGFQVGARWRVEESDINAYIEAQKEKAKAVEEKEPGILALIQAHVEQIEDEQERVAYLDSLLQLVLKNQPGTLYFTDRETGVRLQKSTTISYDEDGNQHVTENE